jgi:dTDP-4-amino-4,6-dideoxygalactose transaminase
MLADFINNADTNMFNTADLRNRAHSNNLSFWVTALSVYQVASTCDYENVKDCLDLVLENFSIIPIRSSTFHNVTFSEGNDFENHILISAAENLNVDVIISKKQFKIDNTRVRVLTPVEFLSFMETGELEAFKKVPFLDLKAQLHQFYNEIDNRIADIITNTGFILGKYVEEFEKKFAALQKSKYCIGVSSGTDALHVALMAFNIGHGDAVIVPVNTFIATAEAVSMAGAIPIFIDCDKYHNIDTQKLEKLLSTMNDETRDRLKALIPVHLYGQSANMDRVMELADEYDLAVIEDCCQAHLAQWKGRKVGNFGAFGAFSFYPGKNLGAYGEAGALVTNDEGLYQKAKMIRQHGEIERYHHQVRGHNYRMEAIQGAVLSTKLKYLEEWTIKRRHNAKLYTELLANVSGIQTPLELDTNFSVHHLYVIQCDDRDGLRNYLDKHSIDTGLHYPVPLHMQQAYRDLEYMPGAFPVAEKAAERILSLPMYPELTEYQIRYVCEKINEYMKNGT